MAVRRKNREYGVVIDLVVVIEFGAPDSREAAARADDYVDVLLARLPKDEVFRSGRYGTVSRRVAGTPRIARRSGSRRQARLLSNLGLAREAR